MTLAGGIGQRLAGAGSGRRLPVPPAAGAAGYAVFTAAMTLTRLAGPRSLDRRGRVVALRIGAGLVVLASAASRARPRSAGTVGAFAAALVCAAVGAGTALAFPVGISAAADDAAWAPARVSVVATLGYTAFLAGRC